MWFVTVNNRMSLLLENSDRYITESKKNEKVHPKTTNISIRNIDFIFLNKILY